MADPWARKACELLLDEIDSQDPQYQIKRI